MFGSLFDSRLMRSARRERLALALTVGLGLSGGVLTVLQARFLSQAVAQVFLSGATLPTLRPVLIALLLVASARAGAMWGGESAAARVAAGVKTHLRVRLFAHLQALGPAYTHSAVGAEGERGGELTNTVVEGIEALDAYFSQYLPQLALAALVPLTVLVFVFPLDAISGLVLLLTAPLIPVFMALIGTLAEGLTRRQWTTLSRLSAHFLDTLQGLTTLKLFGRSREQVEVIAEMSERFREATMDVLRVSFLSALVLELVATLSTAMVAVEIGLRLLYGHLSFAQAFFVLILAPEFYLPLRLLGLRFHAATAGVSAARRIFAILDTPSGARAEGPITGEHGDERAVPASPPVAIHSGVPPTLHFENVSYTYPGRLRPALESLCFEISPGQKVALVGSSGAGKSTIAQLLLRFVEPSAGGITADGVPLDAWSRAGWRASVAWVPQNPYLFYGTVAENISLGRPDAGPEQVEAAARQAHIHEFVRALPEGYATLIGERGARLSGGEAQRIALARAFLKDAPLVILDEATANLDPQHEALIQDSMRHLLTGRSAIIITHRLSTIAQADKILVLVEGRLAEAGSHNELRQAGGLYRRMLDVTGDGEQIDTRGALSELAGDGLPQAALPDEMGGPATESLPGSPPPGIRHALMARGTPDCRIRYPVVRRLLGLLAPLWAWIALAVLLGFATIASGVGLMATSAWIIASAALGPSIAVLQMAILGVRFFGIARGGFRYLERLVSHQVTFRLLARLRIWFYQAIEPLAPAGLEGYRSGDLLARAVFDIETLQHFYVRVVAPPAVAVLMTLAMWFFMAGFARSLAAALLLFLLAAGLGVPLVGRCLGRNLAGETVRLRAELSAFLVDGIQGLSDQLAFGQEGAQLERVQDLGGRLSALQARLSSFAGLTGALDNLLASLATLALLVLATPLVRAGLLDGVNLAVVMLAAAASFEAVVPLAQAAQHLEGSREAGRRLFEILDAGQPASSSDDARRRRGVPQPMSGREPARVSQPDLRGAKPQIVVEGLSFCYPAAARRALDGLSFSIDEGQWVAVVGPSGAGKSTLANLLLGFWGYTEGHVWVAGRELSEYDVEDLRAHIGVVGQNTFLFNGTVRDNLFLARPTASQPEMAQAAQQAGVHDFILSLPEGYDTWIGEGGLRLSGGERQRLAIARALLKNAPILILDEATAHLDPLAERSVTHAIQALMAGRTTLTITHQLSGLETAAEILVLRNGCLVERGRHEELLRKHAVYYSLWQRQQDISHSDSCFPSLPVI
jgi:ATP-binding cassette subfamily C protein CydCD